MKYVALFYLYFFITSSSLANSRLVIPENIKNNFNCSAFINEKNSSAEFSFQLNIKENAVIKWNKENVETNIAEYSWVVYLEKSNAEIGYYYFKHEGKRNSGTYIDLFNSGQVSIFKNGYNMIDRYDENKPSIRIESGNIIIEVKGKSLYNTLINRRSKYANFWILENNKKPRVCKTIIIQNE